MWSRPQHPGSSKQQWITMQSQLVPKVKVRGVVKRQKASSGRNYLRTLDQELILKCQEESEGPEAAARDLQAVGRISLSEQRIGRLDEEAILSCVRLRICNLGGCYLEDIRAFYGSVNLLKLDLSNNQISRLPPPEFWVSLVSLQVLYLDGNVLMERESLEHLNACPHLHILTLYNTPVSLTKNYRHHVVNSLFSLKALDHYIISDQEVIEKLEVKDAYRTMSHHFRLPLHINIRPGTSVREEVRLVFRLLLTVDRILAKHSPVLIIQRYIRSWLARRALMKTANHKIKNFLVRRRKFKPVKEPWQLDKHSSYTLQRPLVVVTPPSIENLKRHGSHLPQAKPHPQQPEGQATRQQPEEGVGPPPPPSSPRDPVEELVQHIFGVEGDRLRFSMTINLGKLQDHVDQTHKHAAAMSVPHGVLRRRQCSHHTHKRRVDMAEESKAEGEIEAKYDDDDEEEEEEEEVVGVVTAEKEAESEHGMEVAGLTVAILSAEDLPDLASSKRENVEQLQQARREINKHLLRLKQPPPNKNRKLATNQDTMSKNDFLFTRVYGTMNLSTLREIGKVQQVRKTKEQSKERAERVAKVRRERVMQREKISAYQRHLREQVLLWRCEEEVRLEERREEKGKVREAELLALQQQREAETLNSQRKQAEREASGEFRRNSGLVSKALSAEDRQVRQDTSSATAREQVKQVRQESWEQQEAVQRYLEERRAKLLQEGKQDKREVDTRMLELASRRTVEAKQRVAKEVARKAAAHAAMAMAREEMKAGPRGPGEGIPSSNEPVVRLDTAPPPTTTPGKGSEGKGHVTRMTCRNHYTWQRGVEAVQEDKQFPVLRGREGQFPMLRREGEGGTSSCVYCRVRMSNLPRRARKSADTSYSELGSSTIKLRN